MDLTGYARSCPAISVEPASAEFPARNFIGFEFNGNGSLKSDKNDPAEKLGLPEAQGCQKFSVLDSFMQFVYFGKSAGPKLVYCRVEAEDQAARSPYGSWTAPRHFSEEQK